MLSEELVKLIDNICRIKAEGQTIELKAARQGCPKRIYDTLSSFSNQDSGGIIIFGIDEGKDYSIVGVYDAQDLQKKVTEQCLQMEPPVRALFTTCEVDGKVLCSAEIPAIDISNRPCYYKGVGRVNGSYIRVGDADLQMTDYEIYSFDSYKKHLHDDERTVEKADEDSLNEFNLKNYIDKRTAERPGLNRMSESQIREMTNITKNGEITLAALLNFGIYPQGYFPQLCITAIAVPGMSIGDVAEGNERFLDNRRIEGTIPEMIADAIAFCGRNMKVRTIIDPDTGKRNDRTEYPIEAVREAILNAVIHRDYSIYTEGTPIQIDFFSNRMEIHSPGGLYGRMSIEQLGYCRPDLRNPSLAVMTETITSAENRYSGIPTMRRKMAEYGLPEPAFENRRNEFVVTFYNSNDIETPQEFKSDKKNEKDIIEFCRTPRSRKELAEFIGVDTEFYAMSRYIKPLIKKGQILLTIPGKPKSSKQKFYSASVAAM